MKGIYAYVDTMDNSVVYVGKDSNIDKGKRRGDHLRPSKYNAQIFNRVLQNNPNRYEYKEIFVFDEISDKEINQLEMQQIALFNPKFNFTKGGDGKRGFKVSDETKKKISDAHKGKILSNQHRRKLSEAHKGKPLSAEHRRKISEAHKGKILSDETKTKIGEANKGKIRTEELRRRLSEAHKGKKFSEERKRRMSELRNTTGYYRVCKHKDKWCTQGFIWEYNYSEAGKKKAIKSVDIGKLEAKVKAKGLEWYKLNDVLE